MITHKERIREIYNLAYEEDEGCEDVLCSRCGKFLGGYALSNLPTCDMCKHREYYEKLDWIFEVYCD